MYGDTKNQGCQISYDTGDETAFFAVSQQNKQYYVSFRQKNIFEYRNGYYGKK